LLKEKVHILSKVTFFNDLPYFLLQNFALHISPIPSTLVFKTSLKSIFKSVSTRYRTLHNMAPPKPRKIDVNSLPAIPHTREHYGNNVSGVKDQPASYQACDLVMTGVFMGTWESMVPKYVQLSDRMVGNALLCGIAVTKLAEWYPCDFILLPGKVLGLTPGRQSSGHPSLDISGKVHLAFGQYLVGDHTHNVDIAAVGWAALTHATVGYDVGPFNEGVSKVIKTSQPYAKVKALLTCDKYYALKSKISAGDAQTEPTSSGSSAKKRKIGEPKGSSKIVDATTSTMLEAGKNLFGTSDIANTS
jgi:hypothetical protein